ncbi:GNAT family N-acetyltransferase [Devosia sp. ZB163]|uniref:GNAT family N-acetyltransferase n=1 Tax=Devosia sp. ZB163 TaxID=3025938 RepID=UPI00235F3543|nr:GNAT family N-acetyltransferase [Devosia sp. ZB163]MDC9825979.1 GNAT family N-acetyltransferase [Devosia sp. ZB163]
MAYELRELATPEDWEGMHRIRLQVLFTPERHPNLVYNRAHPHDTDPAHFKFLLVLDGEPIGTTRLDPRGEGGIVRLVGIVPHLQRRGHGSALERLVIEFARARGMTRLWLNAAKEAVGFYEKLGWTPLVWDEEELATFAANCVQMTKPL